MNRHHDSEENVKAQLHCLLQLPESGMRVESLEKGEAAKQEVRGRAVDDLCSGMLIMDKSVPRNLLQDAVRRMMSESPQVVSEMLRQARRT